ncbi:Ankyrin repeat domain-containing protein 23 [Fusarium austroafricanum]|uniref:Ankyrin repeat domain-containing protein 23 n=1 Tax=Fusarium austroafricanum TaxID=2364996 RepID=A0A8H4P4R5_9HYPO|nr:Ankyrin repeat domain-containing protein 23 [Fusarium austroafricanum]
MNNNNNVASPYNLQVPISSASPSGSNNTTTGRPPLWTPSSRRKVSRLYLYTTLPLDKIMAVVHAKSPDTPAPGKDSGHKTLNAMLNKQPRWLHPKTEDDMVRRLDNLALSPTRTSSTNNSVASPTQGNSGPIPALNAIPTPHLVRDPGTRVSLEVPPFNQYPQQGPANNRSAAQIRMEQQQEENSTFRNFLHRPTFMTTSTEGTTGTLHNILEGYTHPYVKTVKRLIKRYTAPLNRRGASLSPISDEEPAVASWLNDRDAAGHLPMGPHYLPGNFLCIDELSLYNSCFPGTEEHSRRACFCHPIHEIEEPAWITAQGPTRTGADALNLAIENGSFDRRDQFGHTALHLMAARFLPDELFQALLSDQCTHVLNLQNTAGQTLLHVLHNCWFDVQNQQLLKRLLDALACKGFNFSARDYFGRSFSHILIFMNASPQLRNYLLEHCSATSYPKRDAFNITPIYSAILEPDMGIDRAHTQYTQDMDLDPPAPMSRQDSIVDPYHQDDIQQEKNLLQSISNALNNPRYEDPEGRNGLHCLAAATLSSASIKQKYYLDEDGLPADRRRRKDKDKAVKGLDSSTERLEVRLNLLKDLLSAGVEPNHYDIHGNTPLMTFAANLPEDDDYKTGPEILKTLLDSKAQVNARNRSGETALHIAVRCGNKLAVKQLVECGACVHVRDAAGRSVLELADVKMKSLRGHDAAGYAHLEACRAWLSGVSGQAVQEPTVLQEWGFVSGEDN